MENTQSSTKTPPFSHDPDLERWITELRAQKRSPYTIKHYAISVRLFERWLRTELKVNISLKKVGTSDLKQYQIWMSTRKGYSKNTLYVTIKALQAFYRFLESDVADALTPPKRSQSLPKYLNETEAKMLLEAAQESPRDHAMVALLLYSGLRVGELCNVLVPDIDFEERSIRIRSGKGDKDRLVIVAPKCMEIIKEWLKNRPKSDADYLFPGKDARRSVRPITIQRIVIIRAEKAGLEKKVTPHVLRHTLATTLLRHGGDIRFIQRMLGHASIATTQVYTHLDDAELKRMYDKAKVEF